MKVEVKSWRAIGYWIWDVKDPDDVCGICQNNFDATCAKCKVPGESCPLLHGTCSHIFHLHCIVEWLQNHTMCPMCKRPWSS
ncbi:RING/U-box [Tilletiaria anomala UBC 951]|uniref:Anaphase-promoting complex subunit 11 n=1 Tax=Tilletiaria anomala (strain ATCC 24038 / CBS 436.72 / UBC 951) TaxID=1037660 RepID=A0A066VG81_TILAU|nr:RING/U-box [Tilletiaria anomala UBC 951]KDN37590.1 RING/U-box [Tilletiaria anomala UBC 951]